MTHTLTLHYRDGSKTEHSGSLDKLLAVLNVAALRSDFEDFRFGEAE